MLRSLIPLFLSFIFLFAFGCEKDNFDIVDETPDITDPTVIETEDPVDFITYRMPSGTSVTQTGGGLITNEGFVGLATSETAVAECLDGGTISLSTNGAGLTMGFLTDPLEVFFIGAYDLEGAPDANSFRVPACETTAPELELTTLTDDQVAGSLSLELFTLNPANPTSVDCEDIISLGVVEVEFNVPLTRCN